MKGDRQVLSGRKVIAVGDRDGVSGEAIAACAASAGAEVVLVVNGTYVCTTAGVMDLECQRAIHDLARLYGREPLVVILGLGDVTGAKMYAITVRSGDPAHAGALSAVQLHLDVLHILDPAVKAEVDPAIYLQSAAWMEQVMDAHDLVEAVRGGQSWDLTAEV